MYVVAAHIISTYTGSYEKFATERIFGPLGMDSTTFLVSETQATGRLTQSWTTDPERRRFTPILLSGGNTNEDGPALLSGAAGVISSARDLVRSYRRYAAWSSI